MTIRYIVRPKGILTTPKLLKDILGATGGTVPHTTRKRFSTSCDFFLGYPPEAQFTFHHSHYPKLRQFFVSDKFEQRKTLFDLGIPVPKTRGIHNVSNIRELNTTWVVRPRRHRGGEGWRVGNDDYNYRTEYCSELFPKKREYRVIYCRGQRVATLHKHVPAGLDAHDPWNHSSGCRFVTVNDESNNRLQRHTDFFERMSACDIIKFADLVAVDVMLDRSNNYVVCEFNFCPSLSIPGTLDKIREIING